MPLAFDNGYGSVSKRNLLPVFHNSVNSHAVRGYLHVVDAVCLFCVFAKCPHGFKCGPALENAACFFVSADDNIRPLPDDIRECTDVVVMCV